MYPPSHHEEGHKTVAHQNHAILVGSQHFFENRPLTAISPHSPIGPAPEAVSHGEILSTGITKTSQTVALWTLSGLSSQYGLLIPGAVTLNRRRKKSETFCKPSTKVVDRLNCGRLSLGFKHFTIFLGRARIKSFCIAKLC